MSRFVTEGANEEYKAAKDDEWARVQQDLQLNQQKKQDEGKQEDGKSLFEVLQANKAAKQDAFEEASKLKNQFRSLDEDEIDFLDSVLESTRNKDQEIQKDTMEQLDAFRKRQENIEKDALGQDDNATEHEVEEHWVTGKKRKKGPEKVLLGGVKLRKSSSIHNEAPPVLDKSDARNLEAKVKTTIARDVDPSQASTKVDKKTSGLLLDGYSSNED